MIRALKTFTLRAFHGSDRSRWSNTDNLNAEWEPRTATMAQWIPKNSRVLEFGAGNQRLRSMLDSNCVYVGSDFIKRYPDTFLCDLNTRPLPRLDQVAPDVAVFSGVLEYVHDVQGVVTWLAPLVRTCIFSYSCLKSERGLRRWVDSFLRARNGWVNSFA
jgi:hypothetical protein